MLQNNVNRKIDVMFIIRFIDFLEEKDRKGNGA